MTREERWRMLARTFHVFDPGCLQDVAIEAFDLKAFDESCAKYGGSGARMACAFLYGVWTAQDAPRCGRFDIFRAAIVWDVEMYAAFKAWARDPWIA